MMGKVVGAKSLEAHGAESLFSPHFLYPCCDGAGFLNTFNINYFGH